MSPPQAKGMSHHLPDNHETARDLSDGGGSEEVQDGVGGADTCKLILDIGAHHLEEECAIRGMKGSGTPFSSLDSVSIENSASVCLLAWHLVVFSSSLRPSETVAWFCDAVEATTCTATVLRLCGNRDSHSIPSSFTTASDSA